jgi:hypothetical protein
MTMTPAHYSKAQRRLLATLGGLGVAALAAGTFVLSYDDLRLLALRGGAARHWAYLYPGMLDGLVVVVVLGILAARRSGWFSRAVRWLLLVVLIAGAGAAGIQRAVKGYAALPDTPVHVGVAVAPWAILILAVWLWVAMFRQALSRRARRAAREEPPAADAPAVPATVVGGSLVPGLEGETRPLGRPASIRELGPVAEPVRPEPEENPWEAARLKPEPWEDDTEPVPARAGASWDGSAEAVRGSEQAEATRPESSPPASWGAPAVTGSPEAEAEDRREQAGPEPDSLAAWDSLSATGTPEAVRRGEQAAEPAPHAEPSDPVPDSWRGPDEDEAPDSGREAATEAELAAADTQPNPVTGEPVRSSWGAGGEPDDDEPAPLLPPAPRRPGLARETAATTEPEPEVEQPVNDRPSPAAEEEPRPRYVARTSLPTDVRLVGGPKKPLSDTQPDGIKLADTQPDGIPIMTATDDDEDGYADERAEDPDAGMEAGPPSSTFRSGPTPPRRRD